MVAHPPGAHVPAGDRTRPTGQLREEGALGPLPVGIPQLRWALGSGRLAEHPGDLRAALGSLALGSEPPIGKFLLLTLELTLLAALDAVALITRHAGSFLDASLDASLRRPPVAGFGHPEANTTFPPALSSPFPSAGGRALVAWGCAEPWNRSSVVHITRPGRRSGVTRRFRRPLGGALVVSQGVHRRLNEGR